MKTIQKIGLVLFLTGLSQFTALIVMGEYIVKPIHFEQLAHNQNITSEVFVEQAPTVFYRSRYLSVGELTDRLEILVQKSNETHRAAAREKGITKEAKRAAYQKIIYTAPKDLAFELGKISSVGWVKSHPQLFWWLSFGLGIFGALLFILPQVIILGTAGIKNNGIYQQSATNRGFVAWLVFAYLVGFYLLLYFAPQYSINWTLVLDPISEALNGGPASRWFVYGFMYCVVMVVMALRMYIKYRHNKYQLLRTSSVLFFQIVFAFLIPEVMTRLQLPATDFKNAFPLDYDFFFSWNLKTLLDSGGLGLFILVWGIVLTLVVVPVMVYFFGKRWYCSWVCGCGGLAETLGDPYRQHSSKSLFSWKVERWLVHGVLVFALVMTAATLYSFFTGASSLWGIKTQSIQNSYSFLIGAVFAGVIGTGFYPIFGNRVWCRFGCPLAAYLGFVQRFKSRFRISTNGGQCISCGNCSTYCEMGIDVRAYAQKGENIVRSSCVGCGVCAAVCPRGVLKLEQGPEKGRINPTEILLGNDVSLIDLLNQKDS
ncbi:MAG: 4Fe-4S binding protein [Flavobacteriia bacterium]|nr:4Fe-4S binding protein [Flavobacteriia bacterium]